jgi:hypothetical protein
MARPAREIAEPMTKNHESVDRTRTGVSCWSTRAKNGPPIDAAVAEIPATAPDAKAFPAVAWMRTRVNDTATVRSSRTPTSPAMTWTEKAATTQTPTGVKRTRPMMAHVRGRHAISRGPWTSWTTGTARLATSIATGMRSGAHTTMNGAATTAIPKPMDPWTKAPSATASPSATCTPITGTRSA